MIAYQDCSRTHLPRWSSPTKMVYLVWVRVDFQKNYFRNISCLGIEVTGVKVKEKSHGSKMADGRHNEMVSVRIRIRFPIPLCVNRQFTTTRLIYCRFHLLMYERRCLAVGMDPVFNTEQYLLIMATLYLHRTTSHRTSVLGGYPPKALACLPPQGSWSAIKLIGTCTDKPDIHLQKSKLEHVTQAERGAVDGEARRREGERERYKVSLGSVHVRETTKLRGGRSYQSNNEIMRKNGCNFANDHGGRDRHEWNQLLRTFTLLKISSIVEDLPSVRTTASPTAKIWNEIKREKITREMESKRLNERQRERNGILEKEKRKRESKRDKREEDGIDKEMEERKKWNERKGVCCTRLHVLEWMKKAGKEEGRGTLRGKFRVPKLATASGSVGVRWGVGRGRGKRFGRLLTSRTSEPMWVIEVSMEQCRNERAGETADPRKKHDDQRHHPARLQHAKNRSDPARERTRISLVGCEQAGIKPWYEIVCSPAPGCRLRCHGTTTTILDGLRSKPPVLTFLASAVIWDFPYLGVAQHGEVGWQGHQSKVKQGMESGKGTPLKPIELMRLDTYWPEKIVPPFYPHSHEECSK
ncbi:hypothetical protein PR048_005284 [Dryococelus australis]|uniref:Uncharacterized protein n=1 Tax=Dryococelus australis TaxID=614101 RepID=A0ABQ9I9X5_9NEOP|nr:hypothetical protein PR048_005284 [Dryococelus australis]